MYIVICLVFVFIGIVLIMLSVNEDIYFVAFLGAVSISISSLLFGAHIGRLDTSQEYSTKEYKTEQVRTEIINGDTTVYFRILKIEWWYHVIVLK